MVVLGETVGLVADVLQQAQGVGMAAEAKGRVEVHGEDRFLALGQGDDHRRADGHVAEGFQPGVELPESSVDQYDVWIKLVAPCRVAIPPLYYLPDDFARG